MRSPCPHPRLDKWRNVHQSSNLCKHRNTQSSSEHTHNDKEHFGHKITLLVEFSMATTVLKFTKSGIFGRIDSHIANLDLYSNLVQISYRRPRNGRTIKYKIAAAAILNFTKSAMLGRCDHHMANVYLRTKFDATIFTGEWWPICGQISKSEMKP